MKALLMIELNELDDGNLEFKFMSSEDDPVQSLRAVFHQLWHMQPREDKDPIPMTPQAGMQALGLEDPVWHVEPSLAGGTMLAFRHPWQGWIAANLSLDASRNLLDLLGQIERQRKEMSETRH